MKILLKNFNLQKKSLASNVKFARFANQNCPKLSFNHLLMMVMALIYDFEYILSFGVREDWHAITQIFQNISPNC